MKKISLKWKVEDEKDNSRISTMYCFKSCSVNKN